METRTITEPWDKETFLANLRAIGMTCYHNKHPFHQCMNEGSLTPEQVRGWVANRFYYQKNIPLKDAAISLIAPSVKCAVAGYTASPIMMVCVKERAVLKHGSS